MKNGRRPKTIVCPTGGPCPRRTSEAAMTFRPAMPKSPARASLVVPAAFDPIVKRAGCSQARDLSVS